MRRPLEIELKIENEITPLLSNMDYELVGIQFSVGGSQAVSSLKVYIDKLGGITIDDIARASRKIGMHLEVEGTLSGQYLLEVSSPGLDRLLFKPEHFLKYVGQKIKIGLYHPQDNQKKFQGILQNIEGDSFSLLLEDKKIQTFSFEQVDKARVVPDLKIGTADKGKKRGLEKE